MTANNESLPKYTFGTLEADIKYPKFSVKSEKYHLERMSGSGLSGLYLIKETYESYFFGGIEGNKGKISLELMKIDLITGKESKPIWFISESANNWNFKSGYIVFINRGCCGALDQHIYYNIVTGEKTKTLDIESKRVIGTEPVYLFPG